MLIKEVVGDLLASLVEEPDQLKRMELIDNTESLNIEHVESAGENEFEGKYNDLLEKFTKRFTGELASNEKVDENDDEVDEVDEADNKNEDEETDYSNMSFEEAGFKDVTKRKG